MPQAQSHSGPREAKLFRNNKSQAVRIPADFEMPGDRVNIYRDGNRLIIEPVRRKNLLEVLAGLDQMISFLTWIRRFCRSRMSTFDPLYAGHQYHL